MASVSDAAPAWTALGELAWKGSRGQPWTGGPRRPGVRKGQGAQPAGARVPPAPLMRPVLPTGRAPAVTLVGI